MASDYATYSLLVAFNENVAGVFTVDGSTFGSLDGLTDLGQFAGTFDDVSADVTEDGYQIAFGTDNLMSQMQAGSLTVTVAKPDAPSYWNPNNTASPLNSASPGFIPMRPGKLTATVDGVTYSLFRGYLRHAEWVASRRGAELYFEDFLLWASRVYPVIVSTGPTTMGAVFRLLVAAVDPTLTPIADTGISLDDFSADGSQSVTQLLSSLLAVDLGTVFVKGDGTPVYQQHDTPLAKPATATITIRNQASEESSGIDLDDIGTRVTVEKTDATTGAVLGTWTTINTTSEQRFGRADIAGVSSPYVPLASGQALADELVYEGSTGKQPVSATLANVDNTTLLVMLTTPLLEVFTILDTFGGTSGDGIIQRVTHSIRTGLHQATYLLRARPNKAFTVDSALDGTDTLRYP